MEVSERPSLGQEHTYAFRGSTALAPFMLVTAREFSRFDPPVQVSVRMSGSWAGVADVVTGAADAAFVDLAFTTPYDDFVAYPVAAFTIAFAVNPRACVTDLTTSQLAGVLSGDVKNWSEVGGADCPVELINRDRSSGIRSVIEQKLLLDRSITESPHQVDSNRGAAALAQQLPGALTYVSLPATRGLNVVCVSIDGEPPANRAVLSGAYPFWACGHVLARSIFGSGLLSSVDRIVNRPDLCDLFGFIPLNRMTMKYA
jgi:phosphate transport system substrate-binding protein